MSEERADERVDERVDAVELAGAVDVVRAYLDGWRRADQDAVLATLAPDCTVVEGHGPVYRGVDRVRQWLDAWFSPGNTVDAWEITSVTAGPMPADPAPRPDDAGPAGGPEPAAGVGTGTVPDAADGGGPVLGVALEWRFTCTYGGNRTTVDGATVARVRAGRIVHLREYQTSGDLYDWTGTWRT